MKIDGQVKKTSSDSNFQTDVVGVGTGNHQVSEDFANNDVAALYDSTYSCKNGDSVVKSGNGILVAGGVDISNGDKIVCTFTNTKRDLALLVDKTADPNTLDEPGGPVTFTVEVVNQSDAPVKLTSLRDDVYGDLDASSAGQHTWTTSDCNVGTGVPLKAYDGRVSGEDTYICHFIGNVAGTGGSTHKDTVTATITDASGETVTEHAEAAVNITDVLPSIQVTKTASPNRLLDGGVVTYTAVVTNTSTVDPLNVDQLSDSIYGNLINGSPKAHCTLGGADVSLPHNLPVGESLICTFEAKVTATQTDTLTASGTDPEGNRARDADAAIVVVSITPPPTPTPPTPTPTPPSPTPPSPTPTPPTPTPTPPSPTPTPPPPVRPAPSPEHVPPDVDLSVTKIAPPVVSLDTRGLASFDYAIRVRTAGLAPGTTLKDTAPQGTRFVRIVRPPNQGSCSLEQRGQAAHLQPGESDRGPVGLRCRPGRRVGEAGEQHDDRKHGGGDVQPEPGREMYEQGHGDHASPRTVPSADRLQHDPRRQARVERRRLAAVAPGQSRTEREAGGRRDGRPDRAGHSDERQHRVHRPRADDGDATHRRRSQRRPSREHGLQHPTHRDRLRGNSTGDRLEPSPAHSREPSERPGLSCCYLSRRGTTRSRHTRHAGRPRRAVPRRPQSPAHERA